MRIITGLPILPSRDSLYLETGLEPLLSRRSTAKLVTMYKVYNNEVSQYLKEAMHSKVNNMSVYNLRNGDNYTLPKYLLILEVYKKSFIIDAEFSLNQGKLLQLNNFVKVSALIISAIQTILYTLYMVHVCLI